MKGEVDIDVTHYREGDVVVRPRPGARFAPGGFGFFHLSFHRDRRCRAGIGRILDTRKIRFGDKGRGFSVVAQLEDFRTEIFADSTADARILVYRYLCHM